MSAEDELIGRNVARFRGERSQADIAKAMRAQGWKWAQNTVSGVETGERPLRFAEALSLAHVLGISNVESFARESEFVTFKLYAAAAYEAHQKLIAAVKDFERAQRDLAITGDELLATGTPPTNEIVGPLESWLPTTAVEDILRSSFDDDDDVRSAREWIAAVREGREERGANGYWMNVLYDSSIRQTTMALEIHDGEHPEAP